MRRFLVAVSDRTTTTLSLCLKAQRMTYDRGEPCVETREGRPLEAALRLRRASRSYIETRLRMLPSVSLNHAVLVLPIVATPLTVFRFISGTS